MADAYFGPSERIRFIREFVLSFSELYALSEYNDYNRASAELESALRKLPWFYTLCNL